MKTNSLLPPSDIFIVSLLAAAMKKDSKHDRYDNTTKQEQLKIHYTISTSDNHHRIYLKILINASNDYFDYQSIC